MWAAGFVCPSGSSVLFFYNPPWSLGEHGRVKGAGYRREPEWWGPPEITLIECLLSVYPKGRAFFGEHNEILSTLRLKSLLACKQLSWPGKVWVYTSQCNVSESCLLSACCGLPCYLTVRLIPYTQPHHSHTLKNCSEFFWNKNYACKEFYFLRTWIFINLLIPAYREFCFQAVKNTYFTLQPHPLFLSTCNGSIRSLSIGDAVDCKFRPCISTVVLW